MLNPIEVEVLASVNCSCLIFCLHLTMSVNKTSFKEFILVNIEANVNPFFKKIQIDLCFLIL